MRVAARVLRVLSGHTAVTLVHAVTGEGHEIKLEVASADAAEVRRGDVLVLDWQTHRVPVLPDPRGESVSPPPASTSSRVQNATARPRRELSAEFSRPRTQTSATAHVAERDDHELRRLIGLK